MDVFSLEDEDYSQMFITQSSPKRQKVGENLQILGDRSDFSKPLVSLVGAQNADKPQYSDISDDNFLDFPMSQNHETSQANSSR